MIAPNLSNILEAALLAANQPLKIEQLQAVFLDEERPSTQEVQEALAKLQQDYQNRVMSLQEVAGGFRLQIRQDYAPWISRLWDEKPSRYSRALLETLALIAYRQPITRGDIESIRGVSVSSHIIKTLLERNWIRVVGHRDVPGKPAMYGTTREFLDYFNLKSLDELPPLSDIKEIDKLLPELNLELAKDTSSSDKEEPESPPSKY